jgi:bacterioferritin-associated ferredoxin
VSFNRKPINFNLSKKHSGVELFLDVANDDIVRDIGFLLDNKDYCVSSLEYFCHNSIGKNINHLKIRSDSANKKFINILVLILATIKSEWTGVPVPWNLQKGQNLESLVCRCFGVYFDEITAFLENNPLSSLMEVTNNLKAGGGCTSCLFDIEKVQLEYRKNINLVTNEKRNRYGDKSPAEAIMVVHNILKNYLVDPPEIIELRRRHVILEGERGEFSENLVREIESELKDQLSLSIVFRDEDSPYYTS